MAKKILLKIINLLLIVAAAGLGLWLLNMNFPANRQLEINMIAGKNQPMISRLGPDPRIRLEKDYQVILDSPVYFDVRALSWFQNAKIQVVYQEAGRKLDSLAGQNGPGWQYLEKKPYATFETDGGFRVALFEFDLAGLYQQKNIYRFLISSGGELRADAVDQRVVGSRGEPSAIPRGSAAGARAPRPGERRELLVDIVEGLLRLG